MRPLREPGTSQRTSGSVKALAATSRPTLGHLAIAIGGEQRLVAVAVKG